MSPSRCVSRKRMLNAITFLMLTFSPRLLSAYCGRPTTFRDDDITTSVPERLSERELGGDEDCSSCHLHASSTLSVLCSRTQTMIYGQRHRRTPNELRSTARRLHEELWQWHRMLPQRLRWSSDESFRAPPEVLTLQYAPQGLLYD